MEIVQGSDILILARKLGDKKNANKVILGKEYKISSEADSDTVDTFDGSFETGGSKKTTVGITALMNRGDKFAETIESSLGKVKYELWLIDIKDLGTGSDSNKFRARYLQGIFKKFDQKIETGNAVEYEVEFNESGGGLKYGYATLSAELKATLENAGYKFHDTLASDPGIDEKASTSATATSTADRQSTAQA
ncbi:phage major tail protein, TP901-1 family [Staphylococcus pseudintermedius]|nr:phage major tail protein, TP901-1 family [Staphylococcus pseudintermedius]